PAVDEWLTPSPAERDDLLLAHRPRYVAAVERLSAFAGERLLQPEADLVGPGPGDTPAFDGMHEAAALIVGGTVDAVSRALQGELDHALNPAGGLHHALRDRASGFCVYNDAAVAIAA